MYARYLPVVTVDTYLLHNMKQVADLHGVHLAGVRLAASIDLPEAAPPDNTMDGEVVHAERDVQLQVLPLTEPGKLGGARPQD